MITRTILAHAAAHPDRIAAIHNGVSVPWGDFGRMIETTARYLAGQGFPEGGVAVLLINHRLDNWIVGLALQGLGYDTVVARSIDNIDRLALPNLGCVVATAAEPWSGLEEHCAAAGRRLVRIPPGQPGDGPADALADRAAGGRILLTSATTGAYKKVLIASAHEAALHRRRQTTFGFDAASTVLLFDFGGWTGAGYKCAISAWDAGGCVALRQGPRRHEALLAGDLTHAFAVPQMLQDLFAAPAGAFPRRESMGLYVTGGPLTSAAAEAAAARITPRLFTHVGATETSSFAFTPVLAPEDRRWHRIIPGVAVEVVDGDDKVLPTGQEGRLRIGLGDGVAGYLDDPQTTAAFFRGGYFYPGDLAVFREDGRFALLGRITDVINVMGSKLAAGPIEEALRESLGVTGACVLSMPDGAGEEQLHVAIETSSPIETDKVAAALAGVAHGFSAARVHFMPALPRNHMGKIERLTLTSLLSTGD